MFILQLSSAQLGYGRFITVVKFDPKNPMYRSKDVVLIRCVSSFSIHIAENHQKTTLLTYMPFTTSSPEFQESLLPKKIGYPKNVMINHHFPDKDCNRSVQIPKNIILLVGYIPFYPTISSHDARFYSS